MLDKLGGVKPGPSGWTALCPAHEDTRPSLSVGEGADGRVLINCFAGCEPEAVLSELGLSLKDLFDDDADANETASIVELLVGLAEDRAVELFYDDAGQTFARVPVGDHHEVWATSSRR